MLALAILTSIAQIAFANVNAINSLTVDTTSGKVQGFVNSTAPNVAQFLGIPFAEQPVGARRWLPATRKSKSKTIFNATRFGFACPQASDDESAPPNLYSVDAPNFNIQPPDYQGEDCLSVSIWKPLQNSSTGDKETKLLPVFAWIYGGGFVSGGANVPYQNPAPWIERSGKHIVVSIK